MCARDISSLFRCLWRGDWCSLRPLSPGASILGCCWLSAPRLWMSLWDARGGYVAPPGAPPQPSIPQVLPLQSPAQGAGPSPSPSLPVGAATRASLDLRQGPKGLFWLGPKHGVWAGWPMGPVCGSEPAQGHGTRIPQVPSS